MPTTPARRLSTIARELAAENAACLKLATQSLERARRVGDLLTEAKGLVEHGQWESWVAENFPGSIRSAQAYMRLALRWDELDSKAQDTALLGVEGALKLLSKPRPEPEPEPDPPPESDDSNLPGCPNCGATEVDEDGDCISCFEPRANQEAQEVDGPAAAAEEGEPMEEHTDGATVAEPEGPHKVAPSSSAEFSLSVALCRLENLIVAEMERWPEEAVPEAAALLRRLAEDLEH